jgi:hypothetical protein
MLKFKRETSRAIIRKGKAPRTFISTKVKRNVTDVNEDPDNMTVTIDEDIPENNSALQNQNTTSRTSAIIWLITEHTATDHNRRFFLGTSMLDNGTGACSNGGPNEILAVRTEYFREL